MSEPTASSLTVNWDAYLPKPDSSGLKALYDKDVDNRHNLFDVSVEIRDQAESVACLVEKENLFKDKDKYTFQNVRTLTLRKHLAAGAKFGDEPAPGFGTAFLVAADLVLTAGHCVCDESGAKNQELIDKTRLIFGLKMKSPTELELPISQDKVCLYKDVLHFCRDPQKGDWALARLIKGPVGAKPLVLDFKNVIQDPLKIYMLGHPTGLPVKYTDKGEIKPDRSEAGKPRFEARIDAFAGNSGSPVFNAKTHTVIGILVAGNKDYDLTAPHHVTSDEIRSQGYEQCQRISALSAEALTAISSASILKSENDEEPSEAVEKLRMVPSLIQSEKKEEAIKVLRKYAPQFAVAHVALAELVPSEKETHIQKALASGFFKKETIAQLMKALLVPSGPDAGAKGNLASGSGAEIKAVAAGDGSEASAAGNLASGNKSRVVALSKGEGSRSESTDNQATGEGSTVASIALKNPKDADALLESLLK